MSRRSWACACRTWRSTGWSETPEPLVRAALGVHHGDPIFGVSLADARARIETINWVESATVERRLPGTIVVHLTERRPFAVWQHEGHFVLIDRNGEVVTDPDVASFASQMPLVVGRRRAGGGGGADRRAGPLSADHEPPAGGGAGGRAALEPAHEQRRRRDAARGRRAGGAGQADGAADRPIPCSTGHCRWSICAWRTGWWCVRSPSKADPNETGGKATGKPADAGKTPRKPT